jgi:hypothetical protein
MGLQVPPSQPQHGAADANHDCNCDQKRTGSVKILESVRESEEAAGNDAQHAKNIAGQERTRLGSTRVHEVLSVYLMKACSRY